MDWDDIFAAHGPAVWRTAYRLTGQAHDADECVQDVFLAAVELSRREAVRDWPALLKCAAINWAIGRLRRWARRGSRVSSDDGLLGGLAAATPGPEELAQATELRDRLRAALGQLPKRQANVFCLCAIEGWSHSQAADALGLRASHVAVLLHRARKRLQGLLAGALTEQERPRVWR